MRWWLIALVVIGGLAACAAQCRPDLVHQSYGPGDLSKLEFVRKLHDRQALERREAALRRNDEPDIRPLIGVFGVQQTSQSRLGVGRHLVNVFKEQCPAARPRNHPVRAKQIAVELRRARSGETHRDKGPSRSAAVIVQRSRDALFAGAAFALD
mgnify:CR=1 FL=1